MEKIQRALIAIFGLLALAIAVFIFTPLILALVILLVVYVAVVSFLLRHRLPKLRRH
ncbi:MAG: hypothetical protein OXR62_03365 [Ahrensia sp.]|nr:hypothetical protein [Ahrensia sp.]